MGHWQQGAVDGAAADAVEAGMPGLEREGDGGFGRWGGGFPDRWVGGDHDVEAVLQRTEGQAFPCAPPHDQRATRGFPLKRGEVFGRVPGDGVSLADGPIAGAGDDEGDHTATGALMAGWGS